MIAKAGLAALDRVRRLELAALPTPLEWHRRLANQIGLGQLLIKRDDLTGLALGGNKARKLEYLVADACAKGANLLVTVGGAQSNHCRMTAAAARMAGLEARLVFYNAPIEQVQGNMVLDRLLKAAWTFPKLGQSPYERLDEVAEEARAEGLKPYVIPPGGSTGLGTLGYVRAGFELGGQFESLGIQPKFIVCAMGSCGTAAGLALGLKLANIDTLTVGVSIGTTIADKEARAHELVKEACGIMGIVAPSIRLTVWQAYLGRGYGISTDLSKEALRVAAEFDGLILDPVYTAKAFGGLMDQIRQGFVKHDDLVLFVHTGGSPALFADPNIYWG